MQKIIDLIKEYTGTTSDGIAIAMMVVIALIIVFAAIGIGISIVLWVKYHHLNKTKNSCGLTGEQVARKILDANGLNKIKVKATGSFIWGNSYSHYFKKVRLRRFTYKKDSVTSLAMAAQKSSLAILDKEKDPLMKKRNVLIPLQFFGPLMFLPLIVAGVVIDLVIAAMNNKSPNFVFTFVAAGIGVLFYAISFALTIVVLKVETKAQEKSIEILKKDNLATAKEIEDIKSLYKVYNLEYINNMILAFLELVLRVLQIVAAAQGQSSKSSSN
ncbi:MAG: zinc metallopeptidase [Acholeplasmatales bacterium]|nr:zinc metallopeptidase [Acholeplasmatales bacterium]